VVQLAVGCGYPHSARSRGGRGERGTVVGHPPGDQDDEGHLCRLVNVRRVATRMVGAGGRALDEDVGGGEGGCGSQMANLVLAVLCGLKGFLCW